MKAAKEIAVSMCHDWSQTTKLGALMAGEQGVVSLQARIAYDVLHYEVETAEGFKQYSCRCDFSVEWAGDQELR